MTDVGATALLSEVWKTRQAVHGPHSALGYRSRLEYRRGQRSEAVSWCLTKEGLQQRRPSAILIPESHLSVPLKKLAGRSIRDGLGLVKHGPFECVIRLSVLALVLQA